MKKIKLLLLAILSILMGLSICLSACKGGETPDDDSGNNNPPVDQPENPDDTPETPGDDTDTDTPETPSDDTQHTHNYIKSVNENTFTLTCSCGEVQKGYRIQFIYAEDGSQADADIAVSWVDESNHAFTASTDDYGYVEVLTLPNDSYSITVDEDTLPTINGVKYLYNKNAFYEQTNGIGLIIPLLATHTPSNANESGITGRLTSTEDRYTISLDKTYVATLNSATDEIWYTVQNEGFGKYTVDATMGGNLDVTITRHAGNIAFVNSTPDSAVDNSVKNKLTYTVVYIDASQESIICMKVANASSYPVSIPFSVSITLAPEDTSVKTQTTVIPTHFPTVSSVYNYFTTEFGTNKILPQTTASLEPASGVEKWPDSEGSVINDMTEEQYSHIQLKADGFYYTATNQLVYAKINAESIFETSTLASYLYDSGTFTIYNVVEQEPTYKFYTRRDNFFGFVQAYNALTNSDGLYPLTSEMLEYLQIVATKEHHGAYELLCTYPTQTLNFASGEGTESNPYTLTLSEQTFGNFNLSIAQGGKTYVTVNGNMDITLTFNSNVKATIDGRVYNDDYYTVNGTATIAFETKDGQALDFIVKIDEYNDPYYLEVAINDAFAIPNAEITYEFIAPSANTFDISVTSLVVTVTVTKEGSDPLVVDGTLSITLAEGESLLFTVETESTEQVDFNIVIEENILEN